MYISYPQLVLPIRGTEGIAIIGRSCIEHWRVAYYNNDVIKIYDTLLTYTQGVLHETEEIYLIALFPNAKNVIFQKMSMQQPNGSSCGVYSAAMVLDILSGINPSEVSYYQNVRVMRKHFIQLLQKNELLLFPRE